MLTLKTSAHTTNRNTFDKHITEVFSTLTFRKYEPENAELFFFNENCASVLLRRRVW